MADREKLEQALQAAKTTIEGLGARQPLLMIFEDAQWIDRLRIKRCL